MPSNLGSNSLTVTIGSTEKVLKRINQDNFATRYYLHDGDQALTAVVRHSREKLRGVDYEVHNIELQRETFATLESPGELQFSWFTIRNVSAANREKIGHTANAVVLLLNSDTIADLVNWVG